MSDISTGSLFVISHGVVISIGVLGISSDASTINEEKEWNTTAKKSEKCKEGTGPLVTHAVIHLSGKKDNGGTPETTDKGLGSQSGSSQVLIGVNQIIIGRVIQEDEAETDRKTTDSRTPPGNLRVRSPSEDEQTNWDEPAACHHRVKTDFGRRLTIELGLGNPQVMLVDHWCSSG